MLALAVCVLICGTLFALFSGATGRQQHSAGCSVHFSRR